MLNTVCPTCNRAIDLHEAIHQLPDGVWCHQDCFVAGQYDKLVNIAGGLINAIEEEEEIDTDQLREDLLEALEGIK